MHLKSSGNTRRGAPSEGVSGWFPIADETEPGFPAALGDKAEHAMNPRRGAQEARHDC
jgi:hypothetical protein